MRAGSGWWTPVIPALLLRPWIHGPANLGCRGEQGALPQTRWKMRDDTQGCSSSSTLVQWHACVDTLTRKYMSYVQHTVTYREKKRQPLNHLFMTKNFFVCVQPITYPSLLCPVCSAISLLPTHRTHDISSTCHIFNMPQSLKSWLYALPVPSASPRVGKQSRHLRQCLSQCQCPCGRHGLHGCQMSYQLLQHQVICEFCPNFRQ